eukprot:4612868-Heterocapsa_arctica.AAC.1
MFTNTSFDFEPPTINTTTTAAEAGPIPLSERFLEGKGVPIRFLEGLQEGFAEGSKNVTDALEALGKLAGGVSGAKGGKGFRLKLGLFAVRDPGPA